MHSLQSAVAQLSTLGIPRFMKRPIPNQSVRIQTSQGIADGKCVECSTDSKTAPNGCRFVVFTSFPFSDELGEYKLLSDDGDEAGIWLESVAIAPNEAQTRRAVFHGLIRDSK